MVRNAITSFATGEICRPCAGRPDGAGDASVPPFPGLRLALLVLGGQPEASTPGHRQADVLALTQKQGREVRHNVRPTIRRARRRAGEVP